MLSNRIRHNYVALKELSDFDAWAAVFAETLEYRSAKSFNYMIDRTLYRPREIIQFCTQSVESALKQRAYAPINYAVISEAEAAYSDERTRDLSSEYRFQYPEILKVFEVFRGLTYSFDRDFLDQICLELVAGDTPVGNASSWVCDMDTDRLIETLWRIGFLRAQAVGGVKARRRSGSSYLGPHQISNLSLANIRRFQVHPMFRAFLGMKEPKTT
jgi:hypothetical protein